MLLLRKGFGAANASAEESDATQALKSAIHLRLYRHLDIDTSKPRMI